MGGGRLRGPDAENQGYHQSTEMKLCMSHYRHESMPDAKFKSASFSRFGNMTSQNFSLKRKRVIKFGYLPPENGINLEKMSFYVQIRQYFDPPPVSISVIFKQRKIFSFSKFLGRLDEKRAAATP